MLKTIASAARHIEDTVKTEGFWGGVLPGVPGAWAGGQSHPAQE